MPNIIRDEDGEVKEIQENGEVLWNRENTVHRNKISEQSTQDLITAIDNQDGDTFRHIVFEILTGETVQEAKN